jgi:hypothetical protein
MVFKSLQKMTNLFLFFVKRILMLDIFCGLVFRIFSRKPKKNR